MLGEEERSDEEGSFSKASIPKRIAIVVAGGLVNIIFAILLYIVIATIMTGNFGTAINSTGNFILAMWESIKMIFTGNVTANDLMGPIGISSLVADTNGFLDFIYVLALISLALGVTNLLPIPPLDGWKVVVYLIEAIRRKPMNERIQINIESFGFILMILLSLYVAYNDVLRIF